MLALDRPATAGDVLALTFLVLTVASADRANIGIALPYMQKEFGLSNTQVGAVISLFGLAYGIFQIPAAFLTKMWGVRAVLPTFMLLTSAATVTMGLVGSALALQVTRFALGVAEAPVGNSLITTVNNWFPNREKGQSGWDLHLSGQIRPRCGTALGALIILHFGWDIYSFSARCQEPSLPWSGGRSSPTTRLTARSAHRRRSTIFMSVQPK